MIDLLPRKPTCPLKINGWKMYIFPIEIVPFLGDMLSFRGVNLLDLLEFYIPTGATKAF